MPGWRNGKREGESMCLLILPLEVEMHLNMLCRFNSYSRHHMYSVSRFTHPTYGSTMLIERDENGKFLTPFSAVQFAIKERRLWRESGDKKVRFLIDSQLLTSKEAERWANEEYKALPKCQWCVSLLKDDVYTHQLSGTHLFCSQDCANLDYHEEVEKLKDEEEIDYL